MVRRSHQKKDRIDKIGRSIVCSSSYANAKPNFGEYPYVAGARGESSVFAKGVQYSFTVILGRIDDLCLYFVLFHSTLSLP